MQLLKLQRLFGKEYSEKLNEVNNGELKPPTREEIDIPFNTGITDYLINCFKADRLVYCRFGTKYITDMEKKKNSLIVSQPFNLSSFTFLINVKKLIDDHNINSDKKDFKTLKA